MSDYASSVLGAALLQGWTMSAQECKLPDCPGCPLMISKDGKESFCARCDGGAKVGLPRPGFVEPLSQSLAAKTRASSPTSSHAGLLDEHEYTVPASSAPDTPPTPLSHLSPPASPTQAAAATAPVDPAVLAARRQQADRASAAIGQKLLQGWALLGEGCQNESCNGVPLMKRPNPNRNVKRDEASASSSSNSQAVKLVADPRRLCVTCDRDYLREADLPQWNEYLAQKQGPASTSNKPQMNVPPADDGAVVHHAAAKKRRFSTQPANVPQAGSASRSGVAAGKRRALPDETRQEARTTPSKQAAPVQPAAKESTIAVPASQPHSRAILHAITSLEKAVSTISDNIESRCGPDRAGVAEVGEIADLAEHLARTVRALQDVRTMCQN